MGQIARVLKDAAARAIPYVTGPTAMRVDGYLYRKVACLVPRALAAMPVSDWERWKIDHDARGTVGFRRFVQWVPGSP